MSYMTKTVTLVAGFHFIDGQRQTSNALNKGQTYRFDQSDANNASHPLRLSKATDGMHRGASDYTTGVTVLGTAGSVAEYIQIAIACDAQTL